MLALKLAEENVKEFMNMLLRLETFDNFEVRGVDIATFTHFNISGQKLPQTPQEGENSKENSNAETQEVLPKAKYCLWAEIRAYAFDFIKGGIKPKNIKIIFSARPENAREIHSNAAALYLNLLFNGKEVFLTTATAQKQFSLDKSLDAVWDEYISNFFVKNGINAVEVE